jgi:outer membrane protein assembly factor BamB
LKYERIPAAGNYYSSPVGGDGKVFLISQKGELTVISAEAQWQVLHSINFDEDAFATPAIVDGRIYLRTARRLYCFGRN